PHQRCFSPLRPTGHHLLHSTLSLSPIYTRSAESTLTRSIAKMVDDEKKEEETNIKDELFKGTDGCSGRELDPFSADNGS
ncbi:hypothetical protein PMAYCL1PPCAC_26073, partial [Pristionchus mayeri]